MWCIRAGATESDIDKGWDDRNRDIEKGWDDRIRDSDKGWDDRVC